MPRICSLFELIKKCENVINMHNIPILRIMNRKQFILVTASVLIVISLIAVSMLRSGSPGTGGDETKVVATFYPLAYMAESIGGERVSVTCLIPYNTEIHSYSPTTQNMIDTDKADVILYNGGPGDSWLVSDVLPSIDTDDKLLVNTSVGVSFISGTDEHEGEEFEEGSADPHTWISPEQALVQARNIYESLCHTDPNGTAYYEGRFLALNATLTQLDQDYRSLSDGNLSTIIVSHSAFGYVAHDYGFEQAGVIGLSGDEEPSISAIASLLELMVDKGIYTVYTDPSFPGSYATILKEEVEDQTGHEVQMLELCLMTGPVNGMDYLEQMSQNLINLKVGLEIA
jgi:zinc transport system substrate-binding protein